MPFCSNCGKPIGANDKFCNNCGAVKNVQSNTDVNVNLNNQQPNVKNKKGKITGIGSGLLLIVILIIIGLAVSAGIDSTNNNIVSIGVNNAVKENVEEKEEDTLDVKKIIRIKSITTSEPDIVGGVDLDIKWTNNSEKTIKYIFFTAYPINAVGDVVSSEISTWEHGEFRGKTTGPIKKGEGNKSGYIFSKAWYNNTIVKAKLTQIDIEYMDGSKISLSEEEIKEAIY